MPRPKVNEKTRRKTVTFTLEAEDINLLNEYASKLAQRVPEARVTRQTILESLVRDFLYAKKAAE